MKKIKCILFFSCILVIYLPLYAQSASITFDSDREVEISVYDQIDGGYNSNVVSGLLKLKAGGKSSYSVHVDQVSFVRCTFFPGGKCELILFPNDEVRVILREGAIRLEGDNAVGLTHFNENFISTGIRPYSEKMDLIFAAYIEQKRDIHSIVPEINDSIIMPELRRIDRLSASAAFSDVLKQDVSIVLNGCVVDRFRALLNIPQYRKIALPDSAFIIRQIDHIFSEIPPLNLELLRYNYRTLYIPNFLNYTYNKVSKKIPTGYDENTFGPYYPYLHAPIEAQLSLLGSACVTELMLGDAEVDVDQLHTYLKELFPDSEYVTIIAKMIQDRKELSDNEGSILLLDTVASLSDLCKIPLLKGQYLYVDLWATWCIPCKQQLQYSDRVKTLFKRYATMADIVPVYISIDDDRFAKVWEVQSRGIAGYHLRASKALLDDIKSKVFGNQDISIPRYLLISFTGDIVNGDLPRPSMIEELQMVLDKVGYVIAL